MVTRTRACPRLDPGVLRRHRARQRQGLAVPRSRAAEVPLPHPQRLERAVLSPDAAGERGNGPAAGPPGPGIPPDRQRRRLAAGAGAAHRSAHRRRRSASTWSSTSPDAGGKTFVLTNDAKAPFPDGDDVVPDRRHAVQGQPAPLRSRDDSRLPAVLSTVPLLDPAPSVEDPRPRAERARFGRYRSRTRSSRSINDAPWADPVTETPKAGSIEIWRIINTTGDAHPIHIHLVQFQILDRQAVRPRPVSGPARRSPAPR